MLHLVPNFHETGSVLNKKRNLEIPVRNDAVEVEVLGHATMNPTLSRRKISKYRCCMCMCDKTKQNNTGP